ncbi:hypothetical protein GCM10009775_04420 [Microbacterium aoyamense]|uniref:Uncharacterized protein n=1 Tax=Microbacterium aoyamense TaxID=344166 RepID=A0ABP5AIU7_9MICO|nr:hypothetical protein [Microbacterium aoyamense]
MSAPSIQEEREITRFGMFAAEERETFDELVSDLGDVVPCTAAACESPAHWAVLMRCCRHPFPFCDFHVADQKQRALVILAAMKSPYCVECKTSVKGKTYREVFEVVPL